MDKVVYVKNKERNYPLTWILLNYDGKKFWLGGASLVLVKDAKQASKVKKKAEKQMGMKLYHFSKNVIPYRDD